LISRRKQKDRLADDRCTASRQSQAASWRGSRHPIRKNAIEAVGRAIADDKPIEIRA